MTQILTHRGLEPSHLNFFSESCFEAFDDQLSRGFGIEFDPCFLADGTIGVIHAATVSAATGNTDAREITTLTSNEFLNLPLKKGRYCLFNELLDLIRQKGKGVNALHLKGKFQESDYVDQLLAALETYQDLWPRLILFDLKPEIANYIKQRHPELLLAPSVAHPYDIKRYNAAVKGTLLSIEEAAANKDIYDWVWLDEWDLQDENEGQKIFYNSENFAKLRQLGYLIALVTPELHATSPGLLGGEAHPDVATLDQLMKRIAEIVSLAPDVICTDYPEEVLAFVVRQEKL